jgi:hypothetical protein
VYTFTRPRLASEGSQAMRIKAPTAKQLIEARQELVRMVFWKKSA